MRIPSILTISVGLTLVAAACGGQAEEVIKDPAVQTVPPTEPLPDLDLCRSDADTGIETTRLAMDLADAVEPASLVLGRWTTTLGEQSIELAELLDALETDERQCETAEILSVVIIDRSDEVLPSTLQQSIVWLDSFGPMVGVAQIVDPRDTGTYVDAFPGENVDFPLALDLAGSLTCEDVAAGLSSQISGFQAAWDVRTPLDLAVAELPIDPGAAIQAARLKAAELGCSVFELSERALLAMTTTPSKSFVGRSQRLTYGTWMLDTMVGPYIANEDDLIAEPIAGSGGLVGYSVTNRSSARQTGITLTVGGESTIDGEELDPGQSLWVPFAGDRTLPEYTLTWSQ